MDVLQTDRLVFRQFTREDYDRLYPLLSDPVVMQYCSGPLDAAAVRRWLESAIAAYALYGYDYWAVSEKDTESFIGAMGILVQAIDGQTAHCLAYMVDPKHWGRGYATEGALGCLNHAFHTLQLTELVATVEPDNAPSIRVLERIGMKYIREINYSDGQALVYSILNPGVPGQTGQPV